jgi:superfamily II DNA or RNA helicase
MHQEETEMGGRKTNGKANGAGMNGRSTKRSRGRAKRVIERAPPLQGWQSSDAEEIERRRWRGQTEIAEIAQLEPDRPYFGSFRVRSATGGSYEVEIRALDAPLDSCGCADHRVNGLGTCKHIEGVLARLRRRGVRAFNEAARAGSPRVEIFLPRNGEASPQVMWPRSGAVPAELRAALAPFVATDGRLRDRSPAAVERLLDAIAASAPAVRAHVRVSRHLQPWLDEAKRRAARDEARKQFLAEVETGRQTLDVVRHPLLPYQREGMLHLAFGERALLADEMGLGKTVQAIAACELLRRLRGIERVLVVCPASLKGEWEDQIARFLGAPTLLVMGPRPKRLVDYARPAFFTVVNYEQVMSDAADINRLLRPDVVVLDEAQRIKNWPTKTSRMVKMLRSPYAFVLTGTPLENRIDEVYSIVQYLDPGLLGPLFRFNREFYELDERGRPVDYKNLDDLRRRLQPVLLRRRKRDVESELPGRTVTNYTVGMEPEQRLRYEEFQAQAAKLIKLAQRRPLTPDEFEKLQRLLACMRMLCDTPYILDADCRLCPKLEELERVLGDLLAEPERKAIIFSEWERMLQLVRELAQEMGIEFAWHTGSVPQQRRRAEIARFKQDPQCRLFLSTDSGSVGLNLQAASAVINLDLPWNPARLEQRIARAWRKHQPRTVDVINLVTEDSIEHNMLQLLASKQALADGILDGGDLKAVRMPSGRRAFVERMAAMMAPPAAPAATPAPAAPEIRLKDELTERHGAALLLLEAHRAADGSERFVAVIDGDAEVATGEQERLSANGGPPVEVIDRRTYETMSRMAGAGLLRLADGDRREIVRASSLATTNGARERERLARSAELMGSAERKLRMALLLAQGGFAEEAVPVLTECLALAADARTVITDGPAIGGTTASNGSTPADPPPPVEAEADVAAPSLTDLAGSLERTLAALHRSLATAPAAA